MYGSISRKIERFQKLLIVIPHCIHEHQPLCKKQNYQQFFSRHLSYNSLQPYPMCGLPLRRRLLFSELLTFQQYNISNMHWLNCKFTGACFQQTRYCSDYINSDDHDSQPYEKKNESPNDQEHETEDLKFKSKSVPIETERKKNKTASNKLKRNVAKPTGVLLTNDLSNGDMRPVAASEIKDYLQKNDISFTDGYTCYITTCPRFVRRRMNMKQVNKMFINMTTGKYAEFNFLCCRLKNICLIDKK